MSLYFRTRYWILEKKQLDFQGYYETIAKPFQCKFRRADLEHALAKLSPYMPQARKTAA